MHAVVHWCLHKAALLCTCIALATMISSLILKLLESYCRIWNSLGGDVRNFQEELLGFTDLYVDTFWIDEVAGIEA